MTDENCAFCCWTLISDLTMFRRSSKICLICFRASCVSALSFRSAEAFVGISREREACMESCCCSSCTCNRSFSMILVYCVMWCATVMTFCVIRVRIFLARFAYLRELCVSSWLVDAGEMHVIITVCVLPPSESLSSLVSLLSLYGTNFFDLEARALMQLASASSDRLMLAPSTILIPRFWVFEARSDPARSISDSFPICTVSSVPCDFPFDSTEICNTACERDDTLLAAVGSVVRLPLPFCRRSITLPAESATTSVMPATWTPRIGSSRRAQVSLSPSKSLMFSL
mmetsp:Transcript_22894/g.46003  ORF Transcript_22894/g.46003 Transcript_22894/m.46003 type:complete len:286 (-) Transcript_22894:792-1649(-)